MRQDNAHTCKQLPSVPAGHLAVVHDCPGWRQVVPFSPSAGLLQWVEETLPMMEWLTGESRTSGGHDRYARPGDWSFLQCQQMLINSSRPALRKTYDDVRIPVPVIRQAVDGDQPYAHQPGACSALLLSLVCGHDMPGGTLRSTSQG